MADDGAPSLWRLVMDQLARIEAAALTRGEFSAHREAFEAAVAELRLRLDKVQAANVQTVADAKSDNARRIAELVVKVERLEKALRETETRRTEEAKEHRKERSTRIFAVVMAGLAFLSSVVSGVMVFLATGLIGPL